MMRLCTDYRLDKRLISMKISIHHGLIKDCAHIEFRIKHCIFKGMKKLHEKTIASVLSY